MIKLIHLTLLMVLTLCGGQVYASSMNDFTDKPLVGLDVMKPKQTSEFKKFGQTFESACYGGARAMQIDKRNHKLYLFNWFELYDATGKVPDDAVEFLVNELELNEQSMKVSATSSLYGDYTFTLIRVTKNVLEFKELKPYQIPTYGDTSAVRLGGGYQDPTSEDASAVLFMPQKKYYVLHTLMDKFNITDCGDFDG